MTMPVEAEVRFRNRRDVIVIIAIAVVLAAAGTYLASRIATDWRERDLRAWQARLDIVAESRAAAVNGWLERQFEVVQNLSDNVALRLYLSELAREKGAVQNTPQAAYLRNLLVATAEQNGFRVANGASAVPANVQPSHLGGLALIDRAGRIVAATPGMPPIEGSLKSFVDGSAPAQRALLDMYLDATKRPAMAFLAPVFAVQGERDAESQVGIVLGVKEVSNEIQPLLKQPGLMERSAETYLVRTNGNLVEYLSALADGTKALERSVSADEHTHVDAMAVAEPGRTEIGYDHAGARVLAASRTVGLAPWVVVHKVDRAEALSDSDIRALRLAIGLSLAIAAIVAILVASSRHLASVRARDDARRYESLAVEYRTQSEFLAQVTDHAPDEIMVIDGDGICRYGNPAAAEALGMAPSDVRDKPVNALFGAEPAKEVLTRTAKAAADKAPSRVLEQSRDGVMLASYVPLPGLGQTLIIRRDVTAAVREREHRERLSNELVDALVSLIDRRDPFAAEHSKQVGRLSRAIAEEMRLPRETVETATTAGKLLNLGKLLVPAELLTKPSPLTREEAAIVRDAITEGAELIKDIEFDGPVVETLRQHQERWDGAGQPKGLKGEEILLPARIAAVANAFVAMTTSRAFRRARDQNAALDAVVAESGKAFDRRVVAALVNRIENAGSR
ncbi:MAG: HD domain-containing phosphohydrolase [Alphaproteobacteria bacterium]